MSDQNFTCPMCGTRFNPAGQEACSACPLHKGCHMVCCPACGYTTINTNHSQILELGTKMIGILKRQARSLTKNELKVSKYTTLAEVPHGSWAMVSGFSENFPRVRQEQLQAYGVLPGKRICVLQNSPVTVIQVEYTELAIETSLARAVCVEAVGVNP